MWSCCSPHRATLCRAFRCPIQPHAALHGGPWQSIAAVRMTCPEQALTELKMVYESADCWLGIAPADLPLLRELAVSGAGPPIEHIRAFLFEYVRTIYGDVELNANTRSHLGLLLPMLGLTETTRGSSKTARWKASPAAEKFFYREGTDGRRHDEVILQDFAARLCELFAASTPNSQSVNAPPSTRGPYRSLDIPDLVFGFCKAQGTDIAPLAAILRESLEEYGYAPSTFKDIQLSERIALIAKRGGATLDTDDKYEHVKRLMEAGDQLRIGQNDGSIAAALGVAAIHHYRANAEANTRRGRVFFVWTLLSPGEVRLLRWVYGRRFVLISAFESATRRADKLTRDMKVSATRLLSDERDGNEDRAEDSEDVARRRRYARAMASHLMAIDAGTASTSIAQQPDSESVLKLSVRETFHMADVFVSLSSDDNATERTKVKLQQLVHQIFGYPFLTPDQHELGMLMAHNAALRSSSLSRRVGAALADDRGELFSSGTNEVPAPLGGQYWASVKTMGENGLPDDRDDYIRGGDYRDFRLKWDANHVIKRRILLDAVTLTLETLTEIETLCDPCNEKLQAKRGTAQRIAATDRMKRAIVNDIIEYGRTVHAEMAAMMAAARRGRALDRAVLYSTTFPCHECARHIIAAGIAEVYFIEPYEKSRVLLLHRDAVEGPDEAVVAVGGEENPSGDWYGSDGWEFVDWIEVEASFPAPPLDSSGSAEGKAARKGFLEGALAEVERVQSAFPLNRVRPNDDRVRFRPFTGFAPSRIHDFLATVDRRDRATKDPIDWLPGENQRLRWSLWPETVGQSDAMTGDELRARDAEALWQRESAVTTHVAKFFEKVAPPDGEGVEGLSDEPVTDRVARALALLK